MENMKLGFMCLAMLAAVSVVACGDKTPEADASRRLGAAPKQIVDKATAEVGNALEKGAVRSREGEEGKN